MNMRPKAVYGSKALRLIFYVVAMSLIGALQETPLFFGTTEASQGWIALALLFPALHVAFVLLAAATRQSKASWTDRRSALLTAASSSPSIFCLIVFGYAVGFGPIATATRGWVVMAAVVIFIVGIEAEPSPGEPAAKP